jgi:GT2 family glycosyltransferase
MPWDNVAIARSTYVPTARNIIHNAFVTEHKTTWLIMLDSDVLPPPNFITKLWADVRRQPEIKLIGGWYKRKTGLGDPVVYDYVSGLYRQRQKPGTGIEPVDAAGAGCWMMHRSVAEAVGPKPYNMNEGGEDLLLCTKVRAAGFQPYIDWDVTCAHVGMGVY